MQFNQDELNELLNSDDTKNIASLIVLYRTLGMFKTEAKFCMIELMKRKAKGDTFDFESFIKEETIKNQINIKIPNSKEIKFEMSKMISELITTGIGLSSPPPDTTTTNDDGDDMEDF